MKERDQQINNYIEGLEEFKYQFFFPLENDLKNDLEELVESEDQRNQFLRNLRLDELGTESLEAKEESVELLEKEKDTSLDTKVNEEEIPEIDKIFDEIDKLHMPEELKIEAKDTDLDLSSLGLQEDSTSLSEIESLELPEVETNETTQKEPSDFSFDSLPDMDIPTSTIEEPKLDDSHEIDSLTFDLSTEKTEFQAPDLEIEKPVGSEEVSSFDKFDLTLEEEAEKTPTSDFSFDTLPDMDISSSTIEEPKLEESPEIDFSTTNMDTGKTDFQAPELELDQPIESEDLTSLSDISLDQGGDSESTPTSDFSVHEEEPLTVDTSSTQDVSLDLGIDEQELKDLQKQSALEDGIGKEFTDEELAKLRASLTNLSEHLRKVIIDAIVNEKIPRTEQRLLLNMLIDEAEENTIADFIEEKLGYRPQVSVDKTKEGIPIIYTDDVSPEALERRRKRTKGFLIIAGGVVLSIILFLLGIRFYIFYTTTNLYEKGLQEIYSIDDYTLPENKAKIEKAEQYFLMALKNEKDFNIKYFNKYGLAYFKKGQFERAFEKLFGKIQPEYAWNSPAIRVPLIQKITPWKTLEQIEKGEFTNFQSRDQIKRSLLFPGGFTTSRLRDEKFNKENLLYLARFHSLNVPYFLKSEIGKKYKNDDLAIDYYKIILTLMNQPNDIDALLGIAKIYYNQKKYAQATSEYQKIIDIYPNNIEGHEGILNTYIELWKIDQDPRYVIAKHRYIQQLGIENQLSLYTLAKLAGFYIDIDPKELRIKYNVDPVNTLNGLDIKATAEYLINMIFQKEEEREDEVIAGSKYGEGYYQRGRFLNKQRQYKEAVRQFQNAFYHDSRHFPSIYYIGEYYLHHLKDFENAKEYFLKAIEVYHKNEDFLGLRSEDETLETFDKGLIYYSIVSTIFEKYKEKFLPPITSLKEPSEDFLSILREFNSTEEYNQNSYEMLKDEKLITEAKYRKGYINYLNGNFDESIQDLLGLENNDMIYQSPNYYLMLGNLSFFKRQLNQSLLYYRQSENLLEKNRYTKNEPVLSNLKYQVYNNIGATYEALFYEKQRNLPLYKIEEFKQKALEYYYKAIEFAIQNQIVPVKARVNLDLSFKRSIDEILLEDALLPNLLFFE